MVKKKNKEQEDIIYTDEEAGVNNQVKKLKKKLEKCLEEKKEYLDGWQRAKADYANAKRDEESRRVEILNRCKQELLRDFIPVIDSFDMAFSNKKSWEAVDKNWRTGVEYIHSQLLNTIASHGISSFGEVGESFDPNSHNSTKTVEVESEAEDGMIVAVLQKGYKLGNSIIRPAQVYVGEFKNN